MGTFHHRNSNYWKENVSNKKGSTKVLAQSSVINTERLVVNISVLQARNYQHNAFGKPFKMYNGHKQYVKC